LHDHPSHSFENEFCGRWQRSNGARGGTLLGAGAGGFLIFYAMEEDHNFIVASLSHLKRVKLGFERLGSRIISYNPPDRTEYQGYGSEFILVA
jgi:hypothetical protein